MFKKKKAIITLILVCVIALYIPFSTNALTIGDINNENKSSDIGNCTFNNIDFSTFNSNGGFLATPGDGAYLFFNTDYLVLNGLGTDGFGGSRSYYRTFIFDIVLPYSNEKQNFTMTVDSPMDNSNFDFSAGVNSFIKTDSINGTVKKNSDNTLTYSISNVVGGSTLHCQVSFLCYVDWSFFQIYFNDITVSALGTADIIDNQNELYEKEKDEISESGDSATESTDDVPNQSEGFISALGGLVGSMSYNGTDSAWTLPEVKIPQIANVVPEIVLIEEQPIDFGAWVEKIPSNILSLVRAVLTIALIVFCFKELYDTVSYVLTLKGGSNNG